MAVIGGLVVLWALLHLLLAGLVVALAYFCLHGDFQTAFVLFIFIAGLVAALSALKAAVIPRW